VSVSRTPAGRWRVWYRMGGRGSARASRTFARKSDALAFDADVKRRKALGELSSLIAREQTLDDLARDWYKLYAEPNLADNTLGKYRRVLRLYILPALGQVKLANITPEVVARFRTDLEGRGVGRDSVRVSLVVIQAMFRRGIEWGRASTNPAVPVAKPSGKRQRAVRPFSPAQVERIRAELGQEDAALVAVIAYSGQRCPEELLGMEWRHVRDRTLLVEQRNLDGQLTAGQKVKAAAPRAIDLIAPLRQDLLAWRLASGRPPAGALVFPRTDGEPWRRHDWNNWRRRIWKPALERAEVDYAPPYDLRHAFASLQIRAGMSIPELAEQLGHSPAMTLATYSHVIRELKGENTLSAEDQVARARKDRVTRVSRDGKAAEGSTS